ncbi:HTH domain-containing protein [Longitalea arenae]|uniref:HTH domain-containing protein n=1 Tax=Longitalea arenae TaxID=2812558 RepID=UPI0019687C95|nr:HTH domain-containing protein [Longitalea arenae]
MYYDETLKRIELLDHLIKIKGTGTAKKLGERLGLSRATVYVYLNIMKVHGAPIKFCKYRQSYYYDEEGSFTIRFLKKDELSNQRITA